MMFIVVVLRSVFVIRSEVLCIIVSFFNLWSGLLGMGINWFIVLFEFNVNVWFVCD